MQYDPYAGYAQGPPPAAPPQLTGLPQIPGMPQVPGLPPYGAYGAPQGAPVLYALPPQPVAAPPPGSDDIRTIFISGFPADMKERELNNLLRFLPGYAASQLNYKGGQAQGFAMFADGNAARMACNTLHNMPFDDGCSLRAEMARKNMYVGDGPGGPPGAGYGAGPRGGGGGGGDDYKRARMDERPPLRGGLQMQDNPPCNTVFVGNLGANVSEDELRNVFSAQPGYQSMRFNVNPRGATAFVEFDSVEHASAVHAGLQGAVLGTNDRGPIRLQFAKAPLNRKRAADDGGGYGGGGGGGGYGGGGGGAPGRAPMGLTGLQVIQL